MSSMKFSEMPIGTPFRFTGTSNSKVYIKVSRHPDCMQPGYLQFWYDTPEGLIRGRQPLLHDATVDTLDGHHFPHTFLYWSTKQLIDHHHEIKDSPDFTDGDKALVLYELRERGLVERVVTYRIKDI